MKIVLILSVCLLLALSIQAQDTQKDNTDEVEVSKLTLAKKDAKGNIIEDIEVFGTKDIPIYCYIDLNTTTPTLVKMSIIAVKAIGLRANSNIINVSYKTKEGENGVSFNASPETFWAEGDYRVDVYLNGKLTDKKKFKVQESK